MAASRPLLVLMLAAAPAFAPAQGINAGQCIVAGRLNENSHWAPRFDSVTLLAAKGQAIRESKREVLNDARQVRVSSPALLTKCDGDREVALGDEQPIPKEPVPALAAGTYEVDSIAFPKLRRGGELVEVKVKVPVERVVMVKR